METNRPDDKLEEELTRQVRTELSTQANTRDDMTIKHMLLQKYGVVPPQMTREEQELCDYSSQV